MTVNKHVKQKSGRQSGDALIGEKLKELRQKIGCDQGRFASLIGVSQAIVSQWEVGRYRPSPMALIALSRIGGGDRMWWIEQAGPEYVESAMLMDAVEKDQTVDGNDNRIITLHGTVGAGPNRFPPEQAEGKLSLPRGWFSNNSHRIVGLRVVGDSMSPIIQEGFLVLVDVHDSEPMSLENQIVAARNENGVVIKWLKRTDAGYYLVSQNLSYPPIEVRKDEYSVVGRVVKWIGEPHGTRKRK